MIERWVKKRVIGGGMTSRSSEVRLFLAVALFTRHVIKQNPSLLWYHPLLLNSKKCTPCDGVRDADVAYVDALLFVSLWLATRPDSENLGF